MAASAACSHPHVFAHTLRFSARAFLALTKNAWFLEVPLTYFLTPLSLVWQGARTAHTSLYGKDEQCRQTGWIDAQTREVIPARTLRDESTDLSSRGLGQRPWAPLW